MCECSVKSKSLSIEPVAEPVQHAEGPYWCSQTEELLYVDTFNSTIYRWSYKDKQTKSYKLENHDSVGVVIPVKGKNDQFVIAADRNLHKLYWPVNCKSVTLQKLNVVEEDKPKNQFNDGKADSAGRLWLGTLTRNEDLSVSPEGGTLYKISGIDNIEAKLSNLSISNGLDWSNSETELYHIDSMTRTIVAYDFDKNLGHLDNKKVIFNMNDHTDLKGIPDGMTADENGHLWVALFGGHSIINIDPSTGKLLQTVKMPVTYVTSVCFGGPNLDILFVTTSRLHLNEEQLKNEPSAGSVFAVRNVGVKGRLLNEAEI